MKILGVLVVVGLSSVTVRAAQVEATAPAPFSMAPALAAVNENGVKGAQQPTAVLMYNSFTQATTLTTTTGSPRTFMGTPFTVAPTGSTVSVASARVYLASTAAQSYSNGLVIRVQFWDGYDGSANPIFTSAVPSAPPTGVQVFTVPGPVSLAANTFTPIDITFAAPIVLNSHINNGIDINYQGDNGGGPINVDTLTSLICAVTSPGSHTLAVGSLVGSGSWVSPQFGFYRNAGGQTTTFNHANTDLRVFTGLDDIVVCLQLTGDVTPVELQGFSVE